MNKLPFFLIIFLVGGCKSINQTGATQTHFLNNETPRMATSAITETANLLPSRVPTSTPPPTLPPEDKDAKITGLLETNGGCDLPCWWGITPGLTSWGEAKEILVPIADKVGYLTAVIDYPEDLNEITALDKWIGFSAEAERGILSELRLGPLYGFPLNQILSEYGAPSQIYLHAVRSPVPESNASFSIVLFYQDLGFWIEFGGKFEKKYVLDICPYSHHPMEGGFMYTWSPDEPRTFEDFEGKTSVGITYPIEDMSDIDVETFYKWYTDPSSSACFTMQDPYLEK